MPPSLAETAPRRKPALLLRRYEFLLRAQKRKGVKTMKYDKPSIVQLTDALSAVQGSDPPKKQMGGADHTSQTQQTIAAYEADE
jgi:hypothetical protein